jgi:glutamine amidotransferase
LIAIIDYGLGNVLAFQNVYKRLDIPAMIARSPTDLAVANRLILPGVGAFDHAMSLFEQSGMRGPVEEMVRRGGVPVLGVCVGMQILADGSEEGHLAGLGWIPGRVRKLEFNGALPTARLPHMGWNDVRPKGDSPLFRELQTEARFYFLHSYHFVPRSEKSVVAVTHYGIEIACAVGSENVYGVQFHPEKSHHFGSQLLKNFAEMG